MIVLVVNCGSSSVKIDILESETGDRIFRAKAQRIGTQLCQIRIDDWTLPLPGADHEKAIETIFQQTSLEGVTAVGHRVVHGGEKFSAPIRIDETVERSIEELIPLAPLHNPANLAGIRAARKHLPDRPHVAVFDTAFHHTLPRCARTYAIAKDLREKHGIRRYGFHGTSHRWVARRAADFLHEDLRNLRLITCHLGNGCSITAVEHGRSVETSMGMSPLEGLVMGTRCGDIDPGVLLTLQRHAGLTVDELDHLLNKESGLLGLSGISNDMRDIEQRAAEGDESCQLAIRVFCHRLLKYIGAYIAVMEGVDAIIFTAGIGENSASVREQVCQHLGFFGARLHEERNREASVDRLKPVALISTDHSQTRLLVVATDEAHAITRETEEVLK